MKVSVIGLGYIGLPTACLLASKGIKTIGIDINQAVVERLNKGKCHIKERGLEEILKKTLSQGFLKISNKPVNSEIYLITVPTPTKNYGDQKIPDLSCVFSAIDSIKKFINNETLIILESTSPIGTTKSIEKYLLSKSIKPFLAYCPERVLPGNIIYELTNNSRVIGGINKDSSEKAKDFYEKFVEGKLVCTNSNTSEMVKLVENSFRDVNIAFANSISMVANKYNISIKECIEIANEHPRVNILKPGPGVGGHCIAVDPWFLVHENEEYTKLLQEARYANLKKENACVEKIMEIINNKNHSKISFFGISYKPNIDDIRESPSLRIIKSIQSKIGASKIIISDPYASYKGDIEQLDFKSALKKCSLAIFLVKHDDYINIKIPKNIEVFSFDYK